MDLTLIMYRDDGSHRPFHVTKAETIIGRREDCDLRIAVSDVSRKHSKLTLDDGTLKIEDLGSSNGTFVNGTRVNAAMLKAGDVVQIGPVTFVVQADGSPSEEAHAERVATVKSGGG
jgi:pSer/pThr/pTyr-binding forkhead associated (FHA) protein